MSAAGAQWDPRAVGMGQDAVGPVGYPWWYLQWYPCPGDKGDVMEMESGIQGIHINVLAINRKN